MIVCLCKSVSDGVIREHITRGASTLACLVRCSGAGTGERCGACHCDLRRMIAESGANESQSGTQSDSQHNAG